MPFFDTSSDDLLIFRDIFGEAVEEAPLAAASQLFNLEVEEYCCESTFLEVVGLKSGDSILANFFPLKEKENEKLDKSF